MSSVSVKVDWGAIKKLERKGFDSEKTLLKHFNQAITYWKEAIRFESPYRHGYLRTSIVDERVSDYEYKISSDEGRAPHAPYVIKGHDVLSTPGQRAWFFYHYPDGSYTRLSPGAPGSPVPEDDFIGRGHEQGLPLAKMEMRTFANWVASL